MDWPWQNWIPIPRQPSLKLAVAFSLHGRNITRHSNLSVHEVLSHRTFVSQQRSFVLGQSDARPLDALRFNRTEIALETGKTIRIVTAFTLAHGLTLALPTFGLLPSGGQWVEVLIACPVICSAILVQYPIPDVEGFWVASMFGLAHGLVFSELLTPMTSISLRPLTLLEIPHINRTIFNSIHCHSGKCCGW